MRLHLSFDIIHKLGVSLHLFASLTIHVDTSLINLFPIVILFILTLLEFGVALIQAYIFTILSCIYLRDIFQGH